MGLTAQDDSIESVPEDNPAALFPNFFVLS
jgi:hypothetical protein